MNDQIKIVNKHLISIAMILMLLLFSYSIYFESQEKFIYARPNDFLALNAAINIVRGGNIDKLYDYETQKKTEEEILGINLDNGIMAYRLLPLTAVKFAATGLSPAQLYRVLMITNYLMYLGLVSVFFFRSVRRGGLFGYLSVLCLSIPFIPAYTAISYAQFSITIATLLIVSFFLIKRQHLLIGGVVLGCLIIKPNFLLFIPPLLILMRSGTLRVFLGAMLTIVGYLIINLAIFGSLSLPTTYLKFLSETEHVEAGTMISRNTNINSVLDKIGLEPQARFVVNVAACVLVLYLLIISRAKLNIDEAFAMSLLFSLLLNVHTQIVDLATLIVPLTLIFGKVGTKTKFAMIGIFYFMPWFAYIRIEWITTLLFMALTTYLFYYFRKQSKLISTPNTHYSTT